MTYIIIFFLAIVSCPDTKFLCPMEKKCIDREKLCNGVNDCENGADEMEGHCCKLKTKRTTDNFVYSFFVYTFQQTANATPLAVSSSAKSPSTVGHATAKKE